MIAQINSRYIRTRPGRLFPRLLSYFFFEGRPATTSGRWFNPVTFASLKRFSRAEIDPCAENPVFITGTGRSGTTVLGIILSIHPEIGFLNEPKALWHQVHPNDDLIGSYSENPGRYLLGPEDATQERARKVKAMYSSFLHLIGGTVVVDKYPEMIFRTSYLEKLFKNPRYIFLHRNPYDTIASTAEWSARHGNSTEDWWGISKRKWHLLVNEIVPADADLSSFTKEIQGLTSQTDLAAVEWIATMNRAMSEEQKRPDAFFRLGYEDLVNNPGEKLNQLCSYAGLAADSKMLDYGERMLKARHRENNPSISPFLKQPLERTAARLGYTI